MHLRLPSSFITTTELTEISWVAGAHLEVIENTVVIALLFSVLVALVVNVLAWLLLSLVCFRIESTMDSLSEKIAFCDDLLWNRKISDLVMDSIFCKAEVDFVSNEWDIAFLIQNQPEHLRQRGVVPKMLTYTPDEVREFHDKKHQLWMVADGPQPLLNQSVTKPTYNYQEMVRLSGSGLLRRRKWLNSSKVNAREKEIERTDRKEETDYHMCEPPPKPANVGDNVTPLTAFSESACALPSQTAFESNNSGVDSRLYDDADPSHLDAAEEYVVERPRSAGRQSSTTGYKDSLVKKKKKKNGSSSKRELCEL